MLAQTTKLVDSFALVAQRMTLADVPKLHELSVGVGWMHRPQDWEMVLSLGEGVFAVDEIGRAVGSAMWFPMGDDLASVGMVIIAPRLQEQGAGRWLMDQLLARTGSRDLTLNATRIAYRLYISLGFLPECKVFQHNGVVVDNPEVPPGARPMQASDEAAIRELDAVAIGADRGKILDRLLAVSTGTVLERDGLIVGYALSRRFGRGRVVGPIVALDELDAIALASPHVRDRAGKFLRVDTREQVGPLRDYLVASGLRLHDTAITMSKGERRTIPGPQRIFGLINQAIG